MKNPQGTRPRGRTNKSFIANNQILNMNKEFRNGFIHINAEQFHNNLHLKSITQ